MKEKICNKVTDPLKKRLTNLRLTRKPKRHGPPKSFGSPPGGGHRSLDHPKPTPGIGRYIKDSNTVFLHYTCTASISVAMSAAPGVPKQSPILVLFSPNFGLFSVQNGTEVTN